MHLPSMGFGALIPGPNMLLHTDTPSKSSGLAASVLGPFRSSGACRERTMHLPTMGFGALSPGPFCTQTLKSSRISPFRPPESDSGMLSIGSLGLALSRSSELGSDAGNFCDFADFASSGRAAVSVPFGSSELRFSGGLRFCEFCEFCDLRASSGLVAATAPFGSSELRFSGGLRRGTVRASSSLKPFRAEPFAIGSS